MASGSPVGTSCSSPDFLSLCPRRSFAKIGSRSSGACRKWEACCGKQGQGSVMDRNEGRQDSPGTEGQTFRQHCMASDLRHTFNLLTWRTFRNAFQDKGNVAALLATCVYSSLPNVYSTKDGFDRKTTTEIDFQWSHSREMLILTLLNCINSVLCWC